MQMPYHITLANAEVAAIQATGSITVGASWALIAALDTLTIGDGVHAAKVFTFVDIDGLSTTKDQIDINGALSADTIASRISAAITLAQAATELDVANFMPFANVVSLTNAATGVAGNVAMATTCDALELALVGMSGGAALVPATYAAIDIRTLTGRADAVLTRVVARASTAFRYAVAADAPVSGDGEYNLVNFQGGIPTDVEIDGFSNADKESGQHILYLSGSSTVDLRMEWAIAR